MSKWANDLVMDGALDVVATGITLTVCSAQPTNYTEATSTYELATSTLDSGDFAKSDGVTSGRKLTIAEQSMLTINNDGNATHVAVCDGSQLLYVTTCGTIPLVTGSMVTVPAWNIEISDPS